jgi:hypothetical protein
MSTFPQRKLEYDSSLIKELMQLIQQYDNKAHNYFVSTMLTGVLMHHLSWVHTVAPPEADAVSIIGHLFISMPSSDILVYSISGVTMETMIHSGHN